MGRFTDGAPLARASRARKLRYSLEFIAKRTKMHLKDTLTSYERRQALVLQAITRPLIYLQPVHPTKAATKKMYRPQATG